MHRFASAAPITILASALVAAGSAQAQQHVPFQTRNLNPLVAIFGIPAWDLPAPENQIRVTSELANHYRLSQRGSETLVLDGETWRNSFYYDRSVGEHGAVGVELPHYRFSGGVLDSLVDGWHDLFGLPDGGRKNRPEDDFVFGMADADGVFYSDTDGGQSLGDVQLHYTYRLGRDRGFVARLTVKLPTGDEDLLAGSGSTDVTATLLRSRQIAAGERPAGYFWGVGVIAVGDADAIRFEQRDVAYLATVGGGWRVLPRFGLKAQLDLHTAFYDSPLEEIGQASAQATIGGWWESGGNGILDFGVNEDLHVSTAPDVVLHVGYRWVW